jgi:FAD:protein FMN transferase
MQVYRLNFKAMGGGNELVVAAPCPSVAAQAIEAAAKEVLRIEAKYSRYREDSIVSQINQAAGNGEYISCDEETNWLLGCANELYMGSDGLFDATSGILRRAWDFKTPVLPSRHTLEALLALVGWEKVERFG